MLKSINILKSLDTLRFVKVDIFTRNDSNLCILQHPKIKRQQQIKSKFLSKALQACNYEDWYWKLQLGKCYFRLGMFRDSEKMFKSALKQQEMIDTFLLLSKVLKNKQIIFHSCSYLHGQFTIVILVQISEFCRFTFGLISRWQP